MISNLTIYLALVLVASTAIAFTVVVVGIHRAERRWNLLSRDGHGNSGAFARRLLGVYVRQPSHRADREQAGR